MNITYDHKYDLFKIGINNKKIFYNDYTNVVTESAEDIRVREKAVRIEDKEKFHLKIIPSNGCNLTCEYCFSKEDRINKDMLNFADVKQTLINIASEHVGPISVSFTGGGEPTLNFECIQDIVNLYKNKENIVFNMTTNGIFDKHYIPFLIENKFNLAISIDGDYEIEEGQQRNPLPQKTYEVAIENAKALIEAGNEVSVLTVLSAPTLLKYSGKEKELIFHTLEYFYTNGFKTIVISFDFNIFFSKTSCLIDCIYRTCIEIINWKLTHKDTIVQVKHIYNKSSIYSDKGICRGIGDIKNNITILPNGQYSFCHRVQDPKYATTFYDKNKNEYIENEKIQKLLNKTKSLRARCKECIARQTCMGDICPALLIENDEVSMDTFCRNNKLLREKILEQALNKLS